MPITLDATSKAIAIASAAIAVFAAWKALPLDERLKELNIQLADTDRRLKEAEARLKETESGRKLSFDLYQEVRKILERKDKTAKDEEALRVLIESLAEDPFRYKLLSVLAVSATAPEVKRSASESSKFYEVQAQLAQQNAAPPPAAATKAAGTASTAIGSMDIDVFYCAAKQASSEPLARKLLQLQQPGETGRWRLRFLPDSVNQQPGYGITANEIRYNAPLETEAAKLLAQRISDAGVQTTLRESMQLTKWYISVFVCQ
ncbi:hypothetical protein [Roseateles paludis]|jgi:hypothetical protein|uniref:Uncharacterized protein n=1 Tax=Roseateles paludis TaxID=3145238 RepID=A0ABV0FZJ2_9BURK